MSYSFVKSDSSPPTKPHLVAEEKNNGFHRLRSSVDVVAQEDVLLLRRGAMRVEDPLQVRELSMNVADHNHWRLNPDERRLLSEDVHRRPAQLVKVLFADLKSGIKKKFFLFIFHLIREAVSRRASDPVDDCVHKSV